MSLKQKIEASTRRTVLNLAAATLWHAPGCFRIVHLLGSRHPLRCVVFHNVSDTESSFTRGLGVTISRSHFKAALNFLTKHYTPVSLQDFLTDFSGQGLPVRPVLVTFDDAYASVSGSAAPLCRKLGIPAVIFVNAATLDNRELALDNLVCHVANVMGFGLINAAVRIVNGANRPELRSLDDIFSHFLPSISPRNREVFSDALVRLAGIRTQDLARDAGLYLTSRQLYELAAFDFEIGNHTYSHISCRTLSEDDCGQEIDRNKSALEAISGKKVRSFSVPYGSSADLTPELKAHLKNSGHEVVFLAESLANPLRIDRFRLDRTSITVGDDATFFSQIEVLPRLRAIRNRLLKLIPSVEAPI